MNGLYTPLAVLRGLTLPEAVQDAMRKDETLAPYLSPSGFFRAGAGNQQDRDQFLSWVLSRSFCKSSYTGPFAEMNQRFLDVYYRKTDVRYAKFRQEMRAAAITSSIAPCWDQYRQVYCFDPAFTEELMKTKAVHVPITVLSHLPVSCYYLDTEAIKRFPAILGAFVYIGFDPDEGLPNLVVIKVYDAQRMKLTFCYGKDLKKEGILTTGSNGRLQLELNAETAVLSRLPGMETKEDREFLLFTLQGMLYLASEEPDLEKSPKQAQIRPQKQGKKETRPGALITDVGVRYGRVIRASKTREQSPGSQPGKTAGDRVRKPIAAHVRSAHWHHYWTGKGRTVSIVKWIPPTPVNVRPKETLPVTIHRVTNQ